jgi:AraC-like DNA-binding protein
MAPPPAPPPRPATWWAMYADEPTRTSDARFELDFDSEEFYRGEASGLLRRFSRHGVRLFLGAIGGSGVADVVRFENGVEVDVNNFVLPALRRRIYLADEPLILLRASLSCDVVFKEAQSPPIVFNRPELTLVCMPTGMHITVDGLGGVRHQGINGIFRPSALTQAYGLKAADLPPEVQDALAGTAAFGRVVSLPLDHRVASLVADTIDTPLEGEMRALQYAGRMAELVAYTMDAIRKNPSAQRTTVAQFKPDAAPAGVPNWRAGDLAQLALQRLAHQYRKPPLFDDLADELGTNPNKLKASFKAAFGITMAEYCLERRMREAQQLLLEAKLSMAQVAERVGYAHQSNFAAAFSGHMGMSPREYRRQRGPLHVSIGAADADGNVADAHIAVPQRRRSARHQG